MLLSKKLLISLQQKFSSINDEQFTQACSSIGIEVENIITHQTIDKLVVGEIKEVSKHPNADKLNICKVDIGGVIKNIICGANNVAPNKKVIVALDGCVLPKATIQNRELRGVISEGMICAYQELTNSNSHYQSDGGIILLDDIAIIGDTEINKYIGLDDTIYEITLPSNRNDLNAALILCKELSAYFNWTFDIPQLIDIKTLNNLNVKLQINKNICSSFSLLKIENISNEPTPWKLKSILINSGFHPINPTIDKLNYVTILTNIPTAAYATEVISDELSVTLGSEQKLIGFDGNTYLLDSHDIVIKTKDRTLGIAGILGAKEHGYFKGDAMYVELASFQHNVIRDTARRLNISTDAAKRFAKPISNYLIVLAITILKSIFAQQTISCVYDGLEISNLNIKIDYKEICNILGVDIPQEKINEYLNLLDFKIINTNCVVPANRIDIASNQDLAEEVLKFINVNDINIEEPLAKISYPNTNTEYELIYKLKCFLSAQKINEVHTYNLCSNDDINSFNIFKLKDNVKIKNSNNINRQYYRNNLINSLLHVLEFNNSYKTPLQCIYEIQHIYQTNNKFTNLTIICPENIDIDLISKSTIKTNTLFLKGIVKQISSLLQKDFKLIPCDGNAIFYNNEALAIQLNGKVLGYVGMIKQSLLNNMKLTKPIYCLSINIDDLIQSDLNNFNVINPQPYMPVVKDISFVTNSTNVIVAIQEQLPKLDFIQQFDYIDTYTMPNNDKSYTIRITFKNAKIFTSTTINENLQKLEDLIVGCGAVIRK